MSDTDPLISTYLRRLEAVLRPLPAEDRASILAEIGGHIRERDAAPDGGAAEVLRALGEPEALGRAYVEDQELAGVLRRSSPLPLFGNILARAGRSLAAFLAVSASGLLYLLAVSLLVVAVAKPIVPRHVGLWTGAAGFQFGVVAAAPPEPERLGLWILPLSIVAALVCYLLATALIRRCGWLLLRQGRPLSPS